MSGIAALEAIDGLLLLIAESTQRAGDAARLLRADGAAEHLFQCLDAAAGEANATYIRLFRTIAGAGRSTDTGQLTLRVADEDLSADRHEGVTLPSVEPPRLDGVNEVHMVEVERVMFVMSEARRCAERTARQLQRDGAAPHLVEAVELAEKELDSTIDAFFKGTYFHVPKDQLTLS